jgi:hypothetical protein
MRDRVKGRLYPFSDLEIERYLCGDLPAEKAARLESVAETSEALRDHLGERRAEREAFYREQPVLVLDEKVERKRPGWVWSLATAGAAAVLAGVVLLFVPLDTRQPQPAPGIRAMGAVKARLTVLREARTFVYREGVLLRPGDRVRLTVESPSSGYLTVVARGGADRYEVYYDGIQATAGSYTVPDSLILDESLASEDWFVILAEEKLESNVYIQRLRQGQPMRAHMSRIRIVKEAVP